MTGNLMAKLTMRKTLWPLLGLGFLSVMPTAGCSLFGIRTTEEAEYAVVREDGAFELREYAPMVVAETVAEGDYDASSSAAFRRLFDYISGENESAEKVAMTAPVYQEEAGEEIAMTAPVLQEKEGEAWRMAFVLPQEYTLETAPKPTNARVSLRKVPERTVAAVQYSGSLDHGNIAEHTQRLRAWIEENGYQAVSEPRSAGYDPPWTLPFLRRNEVLIQVDS